MSMSEEEIRDRFHAFAKKLDGGEFIAHALLCQRVDVMEKTIEEKTALFTVAMSAKASVEMLNGAMGRIEQELKYQKESFDHVRRAVYGVAALIVVGVISAWLSGLLHTTPTP